MYFNYYPIYIDKSLTAFLQTNRSMVSYDPLSEQKRYEIRQQVRKFLEGSINEIDVSKSNEISHIY